MDEPQTPKTATSMTPANAQNARVTNALNTTLPIPQALGVLYQGLEIAQSKGVYTLKDAATISSALESLKTRLHLDDKFKELAQ